MLTLLRFGRFDEVLEVTERPEQEGSAGLWDFAHGYAHLRNGEADFARVYLDRVTALAEKTTARFRFDEVRLLLQTVGGILEGELQRAEGDLRAAIDTFQRAVAVEDQLEYSEPEPLPFAARHWLGAALIEAERYADAEQVYRDELEDHPNNGWSLFGLLTAPREAGETCHGGRGAVHGELGALRHLDSGVALLGRIVMAHPADYSDAHSRHWEDAEVLFGHDRWGERGSIVRVQRRVRLEGRNEFLRDVR